MPSHETISRFRYGRTIVYVFDGRFGASNTAKCHAKDAIRRNKFRVKIASERATRSQRMESTNWNILDTRIIFLLVIIVTNNGTWVETRKHTKLFNWHWNLEIGISQMAHTVTFHSIESSENTLSKYVCAMFIRSLYSTHLSRVTFDLNFTANWKISVSSDESKTADAQRTNSKHVPKQTIPLLIHMSLHSLWSIVHSLSTHESEWTNVWVWMWTERITACVLKRFVSILSCSIFWSQ